MRQGAGRAEEGRDLQRGTWSPPPIPSGHSSGGQTVGRVAARELPRTSPSSPPCLAPASPVASAGFPDVASTASPRRRSARWTRSPTRRAERGRRGELPFSRRRPRCFIPPADVCAAVPLIAPGRRMCGLLVRKSALCDVSC